MNRLQEYFENENHRLIDKWIHYFDIYDSYFSRFRNKKVNILEIGVSQGGSLQMWKDYFGSDANIYGLDINPVCKKFEEEQVKIFIGSQSDRVFLQELKKLIPPIDILIDDGGHMMDQQIITFEELFDCVKDDGLYVCEDLHTSYWITHGGGYRRRGTFIEFSKNLIDYLNGWHTRQKDFTINKYSKSIYSLHFYDSLLVIEKRKIVKSFSLKRGEPGFIEENIKPEKRSVRKIIQNHYDAFLARMRIAKHF